MSWRDFKPYVPVAARRAAAAREVAKMKKVGQTVRPVTIEGRTIATTFWGKAWCKNLEAYSDYENRLPRGRTYVRNGSVIDLQIQSGLVTALVSGSELYRITVRITPLPEAQWRSVRERCAGGIHSMVELLEGRLSKGVMEVVTAPRTGLFPSPNEIKLSCSCPDWADMCKHVAATLYGVGARLDEQPDLLFVLRGVDPTELIEQALDQGVPGTERAHGRVLADDDLSALFGVDIDLGEMEPAPSPARPSTGKRATTASAPAPKATAKQANKPAAPKRATKAPEPTAAAAPPATDSEATPQRFSAFTMEILAAIINEPGMRLAVLTQRVKSKPAAMTDGLKWLEQQGLISVTDGKYYQGGPPKR
jgi:uncharacterized Zn finger protein